MSYLKQVDKPLYEDIFWSRPERASAAGKLMILGGNRDSLKAPMTAFVSANDAGVGQVSVFLPDILKKQLGSAVPGVTYVASTPSGGIGKDSLTSILPATASHDMLLLAGDFARSSETTQLLEELLRSNINRIVLSGDAVDQLLTRPETLNSSSNTLVLNPGQMQKFVSNLGSATAYTTDMPLDAFSNLLLELANTIHCHIIALHSGHVWVSTGGKQSATKRLDIANESSWQIEQAARSAVFLLQHDNQIFESLTSSVFLLKES